MYIMIEWHNSWYLFLNAFGFENMYFKIFSAKWKYADEAAVAKCWSFWVLIAYMAVHHNIFSTLVYLWNVPTRKTFLKTKYSMRHSNKFSQRNKRGKAGEGEAKWKGKRKRKEWRERGRHRERNSCREFEILVQ